MNSIEGGNKGTILSIPFWMKTPETEAVLVLTKEEGKIVLFLRK